MVDLTFDDGSVIESTDEHPVWEVTDHEFTFAVDLEVGDVVLSVDGDQLTLVATRVYEEDLWAYNLEVAGIHTYYAGATPVLVHNACNLYRGVPSGSSAPVVARRAEVSIDSVTGWVRPTRGPSLNSDPSRIPERFNPRKIDQASIPAELTIIPQGKPGHFEIIPRPGQNLDFDAFQELLSRIRLAED